MQLYKGNHHSCSWAEITGGKQLPQEGPGVEAVYEPIRCLYGKEGQQPQSVKGCRATT